MILTRLLLLLFLFLFFLRLCFFLLRLLLLWLLLWLLLLVRFLALLILLLLRALLLLLLFSVRFHLPRVLRRPIRTIHIRILIVRAVVPVVRPNVRVGDPILWIRRVGLNILVIAVRLRAVCWLRRRRPVFTIGPIPRTRLP